MPKKKSKVTKLAQPLLLTKDDTFTFLEPYSIVDTAEELRRDVEMIVEEGDVGTDSVALWEKVNKLTSRPRRGTYLVTIDPKAGAHPYEVYERASADQLHEALLRAKDSLVEQGAEKEWDTGVWRQLDVDIDTEVRVSGIYLTHDRYKKKMRRKKLA